MVGSAGVIRGVDERLAEEVGARIAQARLACGLTQEGLAALAPFSKRSLQDYEAGATSALRHLRDLSLLLGRPVDWFLYGGRQELVPGERLERVEEKIGQLCDQIHELMALVLTSFSSEASCERDVHHFQGIARGD
jgi:transcriptional regulator with XRE-family HTH domain